MYYIYYITQGGNEMKCRIIFIVLLFIVSTCIYGQLQWEQGGITVENSEPLYWYETGILTTEEFSYIVWTDTGSGDSDLFLQGYDHYGNTLWDEDIVICDQPRFQGRGQIVLSEDGSLIVVWQDTRNYCGLDYYRDYDLYAQKINPEGELLWDNSGVYIGYCRPHNFQLLSDGSGGFYVGCKSIVEQAGLVPTFWHIDADGDFYPGWQYGIWLMYGLYSFQCQTDSDGNLICFCPVEDATYIYKISPLGEFIWDEIILTDYFCAFTEIFQSNDYIDIFFLNDNDICFQKIDSEGCFVFDEPMIIYSSQEYLSRFYASKYDNGYYLLARQFEVGSIIMQTDLDANCLWQDWMFLEDDELGIHAMNNGNFRIWHDEFMEDFYLWEYSNYGELVSPQSGWWMQSCNEFFQEPLRVIQGINGNTCITWRGVRRNDQNEVLGMQVIDETGCPLLGEDGQIVAYGFNKKRICLGVFSMENYIILMMKGEHSYDNRMYIKIFDEDGNLCCSDIGIPATPDNVGVVEALGIFNSRLYFAMEYYDSSFPGDNQLHINALEFNDEPQLVWGDNGLFLGIGTFNSNWLNITEIPNEDALLFSWDVNSPTHTGYIQKLVNDEFVWQQGGIEYPSNPTMCNRLIAYNDYLLWDLYTSGTSSHFLNRIDADGNRIWDQDLQLSEDIRSFKKGITLDNGNLFLLVNTCSDNYTHILAHEITPDGVDLSGEEGELIASLYDDCYVEIITYNDENDYAIISWNGNGNPTLKLRRYSINGELLAEPVYINGFTNKDIENLSINNGYLLIFSSLLNDGQELRIVDFRGENCEYLDINPYTYQFEGCYFNTPSVCSSNNDTYFSWMNPSATERPDEGEFVYKWQMQKFRIPSTDTEEFEITENKASLKLYPNPFNPQLNIIWKLKNADTDNSELQIYNIKGQKVMTEIIRDNSGSFTWDGYDNLGNKCASGLYLIHIKSSIGIISKKAVLLK